MIKTFHYTKLALFILSSLLLLLYNYTAKAEPEQLKRSLPLECSKIPTKVEYLCFIETQSPYGPYDDVVFYRMDKAGAVASLGSQTGEVATLGGVDFSSVGIFMWLSWVDEWHQHVQFYRQLDVRTHTMNSKEQ